MRIDKHIIHENDKLYVSLEVVLMMIGIGDDDRQYWYNYDASYKRVAKIKNPMDGRKKVYALNDIIPIVKETREGTLTWGCDLGYQEADNEDYINVRARIMSYYNAGSTLISPYSVWTIKEVMSMAVKGGGQTKVNVSPASSPVNSTVMAMASSAGSGSIDYIFVGDDGHASIRAGLTPVFGEAGNFTKHPEFERLHDFVAKTCFGWIDETSDECMKKCQIQGSCALKRNEMLTTLAFEAEQKDAANIRHIEVQNRLKSADLRRKKVSGGASAWMNSKDPNS